MNRRRARALRATELIRLKATRSAIPKLARTASEARRPQTVVYSAWGARQPGTNCPARGRNLLQRRSIHVKFALLAWTISSVALHLVSRFATSFSRAFFRKICKFSKIKIMPTLS